MNKKHDLKLLKKLKENPYPLVEEIADRKDAAWYYERLLKDAGWNLELMPVTAQTRKNCWLALRSFPESIRWVQKQTFWMCIYAIARVKSGDIMRYIRNQTPLVCLFALRRFPFTAMEHVQTQTNLVCRYAISQSVTNYREIKNPTYQMARQAVKKEPRCIDDIQKIFHSDEICEEVVRHVPVYVGKLFHPKFEYYIQAVKACPLALVYIKDIDVLIKLVKELDLQYLETRKKLEKYRNPFNTNQIDDVLRRIRHIRNEVL